MEYSLRDQLAEAVARQIKKIEDSILNNSSDTLAVTVNDHAYMDKLERALRRNFDYITRSAVEPHI
jgi:phosphatidylserine/phosphatidylglycerophosphate/cardiolipin synthase-like enzyme